MRNAEDDINAQVTQSGDIDVLDDGSIITVAAIERAEAGSDVAVIVFG